MGAGGRGCLISGSMEREWPGGGDVNVLMLAEVAHGAEARLVREWVARNRPEGVSVEIFFIASARRRRRPRRVMRRLADRLDRAGDPLLLPVRAVWAAPERNGRRTLGRRDFLTLRDPRYPGRLAGRFLLARRPGRARVAVGEAALLSEVRRAWAERGKTEPLARFVIRRALLASERAEREIRGARYKIPRLVRHDILADAAFQKGLAETARRAGRNPQNAPAAARRYLREIAAAHSPFVIDLVAAATRLLYRQGYEAIRYDPAEMERIAQLAARYPVAFLPSHRSNMDRLSLQFLLWENDHPPNHTAGGINMNFFPAGPIIRRAGVFFIRRSFRDNPVYKYVLRSYIGYLVEKRFPLEWYIEGGRSRTGKMLAPRYGLLGYVADALQAGKAEDVYLIPVAIGYDQIFEAAAYAAEQRGAAKQKENLAWMTASIRRLRKRHGAIHLRFGEPLSLRESLGRPAPGPARNLAVRKTAFEVCVRINRVTPVTPASLVTGMLLAAGGEGLSREGLTYALAELAEDAAARRLPATEPLADLLTDRGLDRALGILAEHGLAETRPVPDGPVICRIVPGRHLQAAFYRNGVVHFYLIRAAAELGLAAAVAAPPACDRPALFRERTLRLRDLLKFDFFFPARGEFHRETAAELSRRNRDWERILAGGGAGELLAELAPHRAPWALRSFLEAYRIAAVELHERPPAQPWNEQEFLTDALRRGEGLLREGVVGDPSALSRSLFATALRLAEHRRLLAPGTPGGEARLAERRREWREEMEGLGELMSRLTARSAVGRNGRVII